MVATKLKMAEYAEDKACTTSSRAALHDISIDHLFDS